jgi:predicted transcriptional regulator
LLAHQVGQLEQARAIETIVDAAEFRAIGAADITRIALGNYCAGALIMPYARFLASAKSVRYDIERLGHLFGASVEQVCHRLSTLQRPGARGVPFYFIRVDRAGNILKRHSATRFQFARFGGACPLWNVHEAFEAPGKILAQIAEMPDGLRYLCVARSSFKSGGGHRAPSRHFALGFGCEWTFADEVVYADGLDPKTAAIAKIGVSCRICERADCAQRAAPPVDRALKVDPNLRHYVPYRF